ncbi:hypothetical protein KY084_12310 [Stakelama sp. CBK3Z-3]|uniref:DUF2946 domain-containing protein n=1 Tax=Stakelama flava TaxID=2860338 RepID=A0ABS6XN64_9SPHN|nr:hypothetical protein [Stakelama flava]MBW4331653.1 hypothetical protein [Stakelama flava]
MTKRTFSASPLFKAAFFATFMVALFLRVLVPSGWMPTVHADGVYLTLCDGTADTRTMESMDHGRHGKGHHPSGHSHPCPFAALGLAIDTPAEPPAPTIAARPLDIAERRDVAFDRGHAGLAAPPPPQTGPPALPFA